MKKESNRRNLFGVVWLVVFLVRSAHIQGCPYKECPCGEHVVLCADLNLAEIPKRIINNNTVYTSANFDENDIETIPPESLPANLASLSFMNNPLTTIDDLAFIESSYTLQSLALSNVRFQRVPDAFLQLKALRDLAITDCEIQDWNTEVMQHIGSTMQSLYIGNVNLKVWPPWVKFFSNLTALSITGTSIEDIPEDAMNQLENSLTELSLNNNSLTSVPKAISQLRALQSLTLDLNQISDATHLPQLSRLSTLTLSHNRLFNSTQISRAVCSFMEGLTYLTLNNNLLTSFPDIDCLGLVGSLDLTYNKLVDSNIGSLPPGLSELDLQHNSLQRIPRFLSLLQGVSELRLGFNSITHLEDTSYPPAVYSVQLPNNIIRELTDFSFPSFSGIASLVLNNNPLVSISDLALASLPQLLELQLQNTRLTRLPMGLKSLSQLQILEVSGTSTLVCTCQEKDLYDWVMTISEGNIRGDCGRTNIFFFYQVLSNSCP